MCFCLMVSLFASLCKAVDCLAILITLWVCVVIVKLSLNSVQWQQYQL